MREACACTRAVVVLACRTQGVDGARAGAFLYLFCTHVPAHAVLLAPEAAALHVPKSASHAYSEQVGLQAASVLNVPLGWVHGGVEARPSTAPCPPRGTRSSVAGGGAGVQLNMSTIGGTRGGAWAWVGLGLLVGRGSGRWARQ